MRLAVVGGGLFGCTAAIHASRAGHDVCLFERNKIMSGASGSSYYRLHRGYHYPRSPETGAECRASEAAFRREYAECVIDSGRRFYCIADEGSRVSGPAFMAFLDGEGLTYKRTTWEGSDYAFEVREPRIDENILCELVSSKLGEVLVYEDEPMPDDLRDSFDHIVVAAYTGLNRVLESLGCETREYKFQVVEKPVVKIPGLKDTSIVVLDGDFCCLDPFGQTDMSVLGHVTETVHRCNIGIHPEIPEHFEGIINAGVVSTPYSLAPEIIEAVAEFIPVVKYADYVGSMFTVRAVLPRVEETDERPTLVTRLDDKVTSVFSGKLGTAVTAAEEVLSILGHNQAQAA